VLLDSEDYHALNFTAELDNPHMKSMMAVIDPISYVDELTMPKLILSTAGDEFLMPDNVDLFFDQMKGETHYNLFPNMV